MTSDLMRERYVALGNQPQQFESLQCQIASIHLHREPHTHNCMSQQLGNEVERQGKQVTYTQDSSFFSKKRRTAAPGRIHTHGTLQSRRVLYQGNSAGRGLNLDLRNTYCLPGVESIRARMYVEFTLRRMQFSVIIGITRKIITVMATAPIDSNLED